MTYKRFDLSEMLQMGGLYPLWEFVAKDWENVIAFTSLLRLKFM